MLSGVPLEKSFSLDEVVKRSDGFSGSDLKELCRNAAMIPVREYLRSAKGLERVKRERMRGIESENQLPPHPNGKKSGNGFGEDSEKVGDGGESIETRPLRNSDFFQVDNAASNPQANGNSLVRGLPVEEGLD